MTTLPAEAHENIDNAIRLLQSLKSSWPYTAPEYLSSLYWQRVFAVVTLLDPAGELVAKPVPEPEEAGRPCEYHGSIESAWGPGIAWYDDTIDRYIVDTATEGRLLRVREESLTFTAESSPTLDATVAYVRGLLEHSSDNVDPPIHLDPPARPAEEGDFLASENLRFENEFTLARAVEVLNDNRNAPRGERRDQRA